MLKKIINKNQSVATQLTIWLFISILIASTISAILFSFIMYKSINKDLNTEGNDLSTIFLVSLKYHYGIRRGFNNLIVKTLSKGERRRIHYS